MTTDRAKAIVRTMRDEIESGARDRYPWLRDEWVAILTLLASAAQPVECDPLD